MCKVPPTHILGRSCPSLKHSFLGGVKVRVLFEIKNNFNEKRKASREQLKKILKASRGEPSQLRLVFTEKVRPVVQ